MARCDILPAQPSATHSNHMSTSLKNKNTKKGSLLDGNHPQPQKKARKAKTTWLAVEEAIINQCAPGSETCQQHVRKHEATFSMFIDSPPVPQVGILGLNNSLGTRELNHVYAWEHESGWARCWHKLHLGVPEFQIILRRSVLLVSVPDFLSQLESECKKERYRAEIGSP